MISYSDNSVVDIASIKTLVEEKYDVLIKKIGLSHSKQGRSSTSKVDEYIFVCRPKELAHDTTEKLSVIKELKPVVDNPAGFMHNYMARKPYNIVSAIIKRFCPEGGCVYDPMFGSGTTIIEASKLGRNAIGTDINLLAYKLCKTSLTKWNLQEAERLVDSFCEDVYSACQPLYEFEENGEVRILERCHFNQVDGELLPTQYWYKNTINGKLTGRKKATVSRSFADFYHQIQICEVEYIKNSALIQNSRIAIGNGATVYGYFCRRNLIAIDRIIGILRSYQNNPGYDILELLVSSAINLIKLSDKKASSQMPYWLPKKDVTSRNAVMVVAQKAAAVKEGLSYLRETCKSFVDSTGTSGVVLQNVPAQNVSLDVLPDESVDLILTDPPYTDQVPYLEYNQLWYKVMDWPGFSAESLDAELVVSDAPSRNKDAKSFNDVFAEILKRIAPSLKMNGYFIMFYHSFDLKSWSEILKLMQRYGLAYCGQIPSAAPRKSFKTVTTPKGTLNGNYIIAFQKRTCIESPVFDGTVEDAKKLAIECAKRIIAERKEVTSQDLYDCGMLQESVELGYLQILSAKYKSFVDVIGDSFVFQNGLWRCK